MKKLSKTAEKKATPRKRASVSIKKQSLKQSSKFEENNENQDAQTPLTEVEDKKASNISHESPKKDKISMKTKKTQTSLQKKKTCINDSQNSDTTINDLAREKSTEENNHMETHKIKEDALKHSKSSDDENKMQNNKSGKNKAARKSTTKAHKERKSKKDFETQQKKVESFSDSTTSETKENQEIETPISGREHNKKKINHQKIESDHDGSSDLTSSEYDENEDESACSDNSSSEFLKMQKKLSDNMEKNAQVSTNSSDSYTSSDTEKDEKSSFTENEIEAKPARKSSTENKVTDDSSASSSELQNDENESSFSDSESVKRNQNEEKSNKKSDSFKKGEHSSEFDDQKDNKIFLKGFGKDTSELHVESEFSKFGEIDNIRMPKDRKTGENKGFCFIDYKDSSSAQKSLKLNGKILFNNQITVDKAARSLKKDGNLHTLFLKNLPFTTTADDLQDLFKKFKPAEVRVPFTEESRERNRGFAFVEFNDEESLNQVLNKKWSIENRKLILDRTSSSRSRDKPRPPKRFRNDNHSQERHFDKRNVEDDRDQRRFERKNNRNDFQNNKFEDKRRVKENQSNKKIVFEDSSEE